MIIVNATMRGEEMVEHITALPDTKLTYLKKEGMKYYYTSENEEKDAKAIKELLKKHPRFSTLYTAVLVQS